MDDSYVFMRSPSIPTSNLSRELADKLYRCDGCRAPINECSIFYRRLSPLQFFCSSCGDSTIPYSKTRMK